VRECGGVGDLLGWTSLRIVPPVVCDGSCDGPGVEPGLKGFRERQRKQRKTLGCGVNRPGESGDYEVVDEGLVTYRAQGWAAISAWSWVVV
jgi:hypothetical protein